MDLLDEKNNLKLDDRNWAILTLAAQRVPAFISTEAEVNNSLVAHGCKISGRVIHSILAAGVTVEKGAEVRDSIILQDAVVKSGARVIGAIVDNGAVINENAVVGLPATVKTDAETNLKNEEIAIIGQSVSIAANQIVEAGARISNNKVKTIV